MSYTVIEYNLKEGADYIYTAGIPAWSTGHRYRLHKFITDVPSYQQKCLVEALTGRDKGLWFVCSLSNFARRYEEVKAEATEVAVPEKTVDLRTHGSGA